MTEPLIDALIENSNQKITETLRSLGMVTLSEKPVHYEKDASGRYGYDASAAKLRPNQINDMAQIMLAQVVTWLNLKADEIPRYNACFTEVTRETTGTVQGILWLYRLNDEQLMYQR